MEHFNAILFHKSGPANKKHTNQPFNIRSTCFVSIWYYIIKKSTLTNSFTVDQFIGGWSITTGKFENNVLILIVSLFMSEMTLFFILKTTMERLFENKILHLRLKIVVLII